MDFTSMVTNYNDAILGADDPVSLENPPKPTVLAVDKYLSQTVVSRTKMKSGIPFAESNEPSKMSELMCGCRTTAKLIFIMIISGVYVPYGPEFSKNSEFFEHMPPIIFYILEYGVTQKQLETLPENIYFELVPHHKLFIVQIYKNFFDTGNLYSGLHTFVIYNEDGNEDGLCHVFSSWFDFKAAPIIYRQIPFHELTELLKLPNLLDDDNTNYLFGNNLRGELAILFFPCEVFDPIACKSLEKMKRRNVFNPLKGSNSRKKLKLNGSPSKSRKKLKPKNKRVISNSRKKLKPKNQKA